ncbi:MAG: DUF2333 family protein [Maricaulaceae bacterium]
MQFSQHLRRFGASLSRFGRRPAGNAPAAAGQPATRPRTAKRRWPAWSVLVVIALPLLYYTLGALLAHRINDDIDYPWSASPQGGSQAVAIAAGLIDREVNETGWYPNTPFFMPAAMLKFGGNMVNFQTGIVNAVGRFAFELKDQIGRERGTSVANPQLETAASRLQYEAKIWFWGPGNWIIPQAPSEAQYREGIQALKAYNSALRDGETIFDVRADNLLAVMDRIALDLGSAAAELDEQIKAGRRVVIDRRADKLLYNVKGRAYAYHQVLLGLRADFERILEERDVVSLYDEMLSHLALAATIKPAVTTNGSLEGQAFPNHLANQGFYLLRARVRMREITDILAT